MDRRAALCPTRPDMRPSVTKRDAEALVLQHAERRRELVQLRHAIGARPLEAHDHDDVAIKLARLERREHLILIGKTRAGASIVQRDGSTALVLKMARPRLPLTRRMPPSGLNGLRQPGAASFRRRGAGGARSQTSDSPSSFGSRA